MSSVTTDFAPEQPCTLLDWDSQFFDFTVAKVNAQTMTRASAAAVDEFCRTNAVRLLYFLAKSDDAETARAAQAAGFNLVDMRLTFERRNISSSAMPSSVRKAEPVDYPALEEIAATAHRDTRFYFDGHIPQEKCDELYRHWIRRSCEGWVQAVFVTGPAGAPTGYITCHAEPGASEGSIGLIAVREDSRGAGLAGQLVTTALVWFSQQGLTAASVVTQGRNIPAQRLYQREQFVTRSLELYYHKWYA